MPFESYHNGPGADIYVYSTERGESPASEFISGLDKKSQRKVVALLVEFANRGEIRNTQRFRMEEKPIYCFKSDQTRIPCFFLPDKSKKTIVLTHGYKKQAQKLPSRELERAKNVYKLVVGQV